MKFNYLFFVLVLISILTLSACTIDSTPDSTKSSIKPVPLSLSENNAYDDAQKVSSITEQAKKEQNVELCNEISYDYSRANCIQGVAVATRTQSMCYYIEDVLEKRSNFEPMALMFADQCEGLVEQAIENGAKLDELKEELKGTEQESYIIDECEMSSVARGSCYGDNAQKQREPKYCEMMGEEEYTDVCKQSVEYIKYIDKIEINGYIEDCQNIPKDFYFKGSMFMWCEGRFNNK